MCGECGYVPTCFLSLDLIIHMWEIQFDENLGWVEVSNKVLSGLIGCFFLFFVLSLSLNGFICFSLNSLSILQSSWELLQLDSLSVCVSWLSAGSLYLHIGGALLLVEWQVWYGVRAWCLKSSPFCHQITKAIGLVYCHERRMRM